MSLKLKPVPQGQIFKLQGLFTKIIEEMNATDRTTADEQIVNFDRGYNGKYLAIYTDNIDDPKHCLILAHYPKMIGSGFLCAVIMIYSLPDYRGDVEALDAFHLTIDNYAQHQVCDEILGSSWKYAGARGIDPMWLSRGYQIQETTFVKLVI